MNREHNFMKKHAALAAAGSILLAGAFGAGTIAGSIMPVLASAEETTEEASDSTAETLAGTADDSLADSTIYTGLPDVSDIVENCLPSVVAITNTIEVTQTSSSYGNWFGMYNYGNGNQGNSGNTTTQETEAYGSGVIIGENESELLIVTNNHVAVYDESGNSSFYSYSASTKSLSVEFADGTDHEAYLKGADADADLAVIAVKLDDIDESTMDAIRVATIGSSDDAKVGQGVIAIGNALGLGQTTTVGYISALNRELTSSEDNVTRTLMQVDAAINGGNSGGGLFNAQGELIGINCAKYSGVGIEGIGYAIPISSAIDIIDDLKIQTTKIALTDDERGYLGIYGTDVSSAYVQNYGYPEGAQVIQVTDGSPAEAAGLQMGDIITAVNGTAIDDYDSLRTQLGYYAPGDVVTLTVQRISGNSFEEMTLDVTLATKDSTIQ